MTATQAGPDQHGHVRGIPLLPEPAPRRRVGDLVTLPGDPRFTGEIYRVERVNPTTYRLAPQIRGGPDVKASHVLVADAPVGAADQIAKAKAGVNILPHQVLGALVRWNGTKPVAGIEPGEVCVVIADKGATVNIAKIGGFGDRYGKPPRRMLTAATPADLPEDLR